MHYWKEKVPGQFSSETFPCFLEHGDGPNDTFCVYGLPAEEYPGLVKVRYLYDRFMLMEITFSIFLNFFYVISMFFML